MTAMESDATANALIMDVLLCFMANRLPILILPLILSVATMIFISKLTMSILNFCLHP